MIVEEVVAAEVEAIVDGNEKFTDEVEEPIGIVDDFDVFSSSCVILLATIVDSGCIGEEEPN
jgi:hypothetical protein